MPFQFRFFFISVSFFCLSLAQASPLYTIDLFKDIHLDLKESTPIKEALELIVSEKEVKLTAQKMKELLKLMDFPELFSVKNGSSARNRPKCFLFKTTVSSQLKISIDDKEWLRQRNFFCRGMRESDSERCRPRRPSKILGFKGLDIEWNEVTELMKKEERPLAECSQAPEQSKSSEVELVSKINKCILDEGFKSKRDEECGDLSDDEMELKLSDDNRWKINKTVNWERAELKLEKAEETFSFDYQQSLEKISFYDNYSRLLITLRKEPSGQSFKSLKKHKLRLFYYPEKDVKLTLKVKYRLKGHPTKRVEEYAGELRPRLSEFHHSQNCRLFSSHQVTEERDIGAVPTFFYKSSPDGKWFSFTTFKNSYSNPDQTNFLFKMSSGKMVKLKGKFDPVFHLNKRMMSIPDFPKALAFYQLQNPEKPGEISLNQKFYDREMKGAYQSISILEQTPETTTYRVIIEKSGRGVYMRDYFEEFMGLKVTSFKPLGPIKKACPKISLKLPMISKNGQFISGFNPDTASTNIFRLDDDGICHLVHDFKMITGKMSFSYDGRFVAYHKFKTKKKRKEFATWFDLPKSTTTADIYVFELESKKSFKLTDNRSSNTLFPDFLKDGRMTYVEHPHGNSKEPSFKIVLNPLSNQYKCD